MQLVTAAEARRLDELTIHEYGTPGLVLMERAGAGATEALLDLFPHVRRGRVVVVCGKGNNGGDGLVIARLLVRRRVRAEVVLLAAAAELSGDAAHMLRLAKKAKVPVSVCATTADLTKLSRRLAGASVVVDAVFGTGLNAEVGGRFADVIQMVNACGAPVLAVDIPSGLDADTGRPLGVAVQAGATATFGFAKVGHVIHPGVDTVGTLCVVDIGIAPEAVTTVRPQTWLLDPHAVGGLVPARVAEAHKGTAGHLLIFAGSLGHTGAARLVAHAACRTGAGLTTLAGPASLNGVFSSAVPEVMTAPLADRDGFVLFDETHLRRVLEGKSAVVVGPGLGTHEDAERIVQFLVHETTLPLVIDADALTCIARAPFTLAKAGSRAVLTPHPGEMARLLRTDPTTVQANRPARAREFATAHGCVLVLKGARTVIAGADGSVWINPTGNPGMASGGMGDALSGMLGALLAQGLAPADAACLGVYAHGQCGDVAAADLGPIGVLATDVIERVPATLRRLRGHGGLDGEAAADSAVRPMRRRPHRDRRP